MQKRVLLVEDHKDTCSEICAIVKKLGFIVDSARTGEEGLKFLNSNTDMDIALLDIDLGAGMNGLEVLEKIRKAHKYVQVIMVTGDNTLATGIKSMQKGAVDYIAKPFKGSEFAEKAARAVRIKESELLKDIYSDLIVNDIRNLLDCFRASFKLYTEQKDKNKTSSAATLDFGIKQLSCLIENVNAIKKYEENALKLYPKEFNFRNELEEEIKPLIEKYNGKLLVEYKIPKGYIIKTDRGLLSLVFWNLLLLANNILSEASKIRIIAEESREALNVTIKYLGLEMDILRRKEIFNKYSYIMHKLDSPNPNFALGLTFCKYATSLLGSELIVENESKAITLSFSVNNLKK